MLPAGLGLRARDGDGLVAVPAAFGKGPQRARAGRISTPPRPAQPATREDANWRDSRRFRSAWGTLETLWRVSSIDRQRKCRRCSRSLSGDVAIANHGGRGIVSNVTTCGSVWTCPMCSGRIRGERAREIAAALGSVVDQGGDVAHLIVTTPHAAGWSTSAGQDVLSAVWAAAWGAVAVQAGLTHAGYDGYVRGLDHTFGDAGPHAHFHAMVAFTRELEPGHLEALRAEMTAAGDRYLERVGLPPLHPEHGIRFERMDLAEGLEAVASYVVKPEAAAADVDRARAGYEVAGGRTKTAGGDHRTPFEVLADFSTWGDARDLALWGEYERATAGKRHTVWSRNGFRDRHVCAPERTDDEIADEHDEESRTVSTLDRDQWAAVISERGRLPELLELVTRSADDDDQAHAAITAALQNWGCGPPRRGSP